MLLSDCGNATGHPTQWFWVGVKDRDCAPYGKNRIEYACVGSHWKAPPAVDSYFGIFVLQAPVCSATGSANGSGMKSAHGCEAEPPEAHMSKTLRSSSRTVESNKPLSLKWSRVFRTCVLSGVSEAVDGSLVLGARQEIVDCRLSIELRYRNERTCHRKALGRVFVSTSSLLCRRDSVAKNC
jgi:hypothetical protein